MKTSCHPAFPLLTIGCLALSGLATTARAATMSASTIAPTASGLDIANLAAPTATDKWFFENTTGAGAAKGQTFTTGAIPSLLRSVTIRTSTGAAATKGYKIRVGTVSSTTFTEVRSETATQAFQWNAGEYMKYTFATPVQLLPNTLYGVDVGMISSSSSWQTGIPYIYLSGSTYSGGQLYNSGTNGLGTGTIALISGSDRTFHLDIQHPLTPNPDFGALVPAGDLTLSWTNPTPTTGTDVWVNVWFGTDPGALTKVADAQLNLTSFPVNLPGANNYYWRIDSYLDGTPTGTPAQSTVFNFIVTDSDSDGFPDSYELLHTDPTSATALNREDDRDNDGLTNWVEFNQNTNPSNPDGDDDGLLDANNITVTSADPRYAAWATEGIFHADSGADRTFRSEAASGTDPRKSDTDSDGLIDGVETNTGVYAGTTNTGTNPLNADTDADGLKDGVETNTGLFVSKTDTGTHPLVSDTDADGAGDWYEVTASFTSPVLAAEKPNVPYPLPDPDASTGAPNKRVKVYIMSGQSNMVGEGTINGTDTNALETMTRRENKFPNLVDGSGNYLARQDVRYRGVIKALGNGLLAPGFGKSSSFFGPELGFGQIMGWFHDEPVLLIKASEGNRALGWDILPPGGVRYTYGTSTYPASGEAPESWLTASGAEGPRSWYAGKQYDDYFLNETDMGMRPWVPGTAYPSGCQIKHNGVAYISKSAHTAAATSEPGVGETWSTLWSAYSVTNVVDVLDNFATQYPQWAAQGFEIAGFVWWQGDRDRGTEAYATRYQQNLVRLINSLRAYYSNRYPGKVALNAPFVLATLGQTPLDAAPSNDKSLLDAMLAVDGDAGNHPQFSGNVKTVYSHPLSEGGASNSHYNQRAGTYMLVGDALGRAMVELQSSSSGNTYDSWIAGFPSVPPNLAGFEQDADGDGIENGAENFFGTNPGISSTGLVSGASSGNTFTFTHPQSAAPANGVTGTYRWSKDLATFYNHDQTDAANTTVSFNAVTNAGITTVTATVTGTATTKLFVDVWVRQN